ncbi:DNA modification methylase [Candidatus Accumulibacter sp. ACC012]|uniref:DNA modification methylase n=1 Tax=Candidatus Accumulibacter sp. ACC012 TaxID=2823332 RepID=UPI0025BEF3A2|nr:DNA modification methylase [Candidatus Accumulibacter sp. ACC012]
MVASELTLEQWPVDRLLDYARNPRNNDHAVEQMAAVITEFGFRIPVVARSTGEIVDGHLRLKAARRLGLTSVPVVLADELSDAQIKAFRLLANRSATWAEWDDAMLALELEDLKLADFDLSLTGFDADEIEALLSNDADGGDGGQQPESDAADDVPDVPTNPVARTGDVWALGQHRLICGDAADSAVITTLMAGDRARVCFTSPPYGNQRDYTSGGITDWDGLMRGVFVDLPMSDDGQVLVNLGLIHRDNEVSPYWDGWLAWMRTEGWRRFAWYVWDQGPGMPGDWAGRFAPSFEFVFHFNHQSRKPNKIVPCKHAGQESHLRADGSSTAMRSKNGEVGGWTAAGQPTQDNRIPDSVIRVMRHKGKIGQDIDHPAVFPIALPEFILEAYSDTGDLVFEPFCGSGTTMLAAQRTGRIARSVEIAPEYVDVAIKRFQQNFAGVPVTLAATGQTFTEVADERLGSDDADR